MRYLAGWLQRSALLPWVVAVGLCVAQEAWYTNRGTELRSAPEEGAAVVLAVPGNTKLVIAERRGGWSRVKLESPDMTTGWVRAWHLRGGTTVQVEQASGGGTSFLGGLNRLLGGNAQPQRAQSATLGVRGLSPDELKTASPNPEQLTALKAAVVDKGDAEKFAGEVPLQKQDIAVPAEQTRGGRR